MNRNILAFHFRAEMVRGWDGYLTPCMFAKLMELGLTKLGQVFIN